MPDEIILFMKQFIGASLEPTLMIVTEFMRGGTLQKYLVDMHPNCLDLELSVRLALGISRAMTYLHAKGIIHRDLKPSNHRLPMSNFALCFGDCGHGHTILSMTILSFYLLQS